jgi:hypothetical protein
VCITCEPHQSNECPVYERAAAGWSWLPHLQLDQQLYLAQLKIARSGSVTPYLSLNAVTLQAGIIPRALRFIFDHLQLHGLPPCVVPPSQTGIEKAQEVTSSPSISHGVAGPHSMHASAADMGVPASWKVTLSALEIYQVKEVG